MAHVVMCWELGADLGHVARMKPLAEALLRRGRRVSFIVREALSAERLLDAGRTPWFQAPYQSDAVPSPIVPTLSLPGVMHNTGFHDLRSLLARLHAWRNLYAALAPDLLVFDHSPTAMLAARGLKVRRVVLGTGFGIPPAVYPMPGFDDSATGLAAIEDRVTATANEALRALGEAALARLADLYAADASLFFTFRELDHYANRNAGDYWGPTRQDGGVAPAWPSTAGRRVFAYLKPFKTLPALLDTFQQSGHPTLIYLGKGADETRARYAGAANLSFSDKPVDLKRAAADADLLVCHSGHGTISSALLAGKPLLLLPLNMEQRMLAQRVEQAGAGLAAPALAPEGMHAKFQRLLAEPAFTAAARDFAERYSRLEVEHIPERFAALAERLLASEAP
ncbi:MAG TPA: nucleotide disphospho-sugar-binding domain-containing protein [Gammaproteobacteria bacterium]